MAFFIADVTDWKDKRDSSYRIAPADAGVRDFVLNPNHIGELKVGDDSTVPIPTSWFQYWDNHLDRRESNGYIKANIALSSITTAADTAFHSNSITLPIFKHNNPDNDTVDITIPVTCIAYADRYNPAPHDYCWVIFYLASWKRREVLTALTLEQIELLGNHGTLTTPD
jgi:hypothetical protein